MLMNNQRKAPKKGFIHRILTRKQEKEAQKKLLQQKAREAVAVNRSIKGQP